MKRGDILESINVRFKELRIACKRSQEEWGEILGLTKSGVSDIERGKRNVTDKHLVMLGNWSEKPVNIEWLRSGTGDMFKKLSRQQELAKLTADLFKSEETSFKSRFILALSELEENEWDVLEGIVQKIAKKKD